MNIRSLCIIIVTIASLAFPVKSQGIGVDINTDAKTITALETAFASELAAESGILGSLKDMTKHYTEASIAMSGIYLMKKSDRKALEDERAFVREEFMHFKLCCKFASLIMIKTLNITKLLAERPEAILQWGPYIYDVITKTKEHCKQYSAIVTNGKQKVTLEGVAREIGWLAFGDEMIEVLTLMRFANIDWKSIIDDFGGDFDELTKNISIEDIGDALLDLVNKSEDFATNDIATAGADIWNDMFGNLNTNDTNNNSDDKKKLGKTKSKIKQIVNIARSLYGLYNLIDNPQTLKSMFLEKLGLSEPLDPNQLINRIFKKEDDLDISSYANNYETPDSLTTYEQMWHIVRKLDKVETVDEFNPNLYEDNNYWTIFSNYSTKFPLSLTLSECDLVMNKSESFLKNKWTRAECEKRSTTNNKYVFYSQLNSKKVNLINKEYWAAAYYIRVQHEIHEKKVMYSAKFFSDKQDETSFEIEMRKLMYNYQDRDTVSGVKYEIVKDAPVYTEKPDTARLKNSASVIYKVKCKDGGEVSSGFFWWKVTPSFRYSDLNSAEARKRAIEYAMQTGVDPNTLDTDSVDMAIEAAKDSIEDLKKEKIELEQKRTDISQKIIDARLQGYPSSTIESLVAEQNSIINRISTIENELATLNNHISMYNDARTEIMNDYYEKDTGDRIPSKENELARLFNLEWINDTGEWNGLTYTHKGLTGSDKGEIGYQWTFTGKLSLKAKEKRVLGVRIHRAHLQVDWTLNGNVESEVIAYVLPIDSTWSTETREAKVKERLKRVRADYPDCDVSLEYEKIDNIDDKDEKAMHLLWPQERLALARDLSSRLINIYSRLVEVERYIHYTKSTSDWLKLKFGRPMRPAKRGNKPDSCFRKWLKRAEDNVKSKNNDLI